MTKHKIFINGMIIDPNAKYESGNFQLEWEVPKPKMEKKKMSLIERIEALENRIRDLESIKSNSQEMCYLENKIDKLSDLIGCESNGHVEPTKEEPQVTHSNGSTYSYSDDDNGEFVIQRDDGKYFQRVSNNSFIGAQKPYWTRFLSRAKRFENVTEASKVIKKYKIKKAVAKQQNNL